MTFFQCFSRNIDFPIVKADIHSEIILGWLIQVLFNISPKKYSSTTQLFNYPDSFQRTSLPKLFTEHMKVFNKENAYKNKYRGCGPFCNHQSDSLVLCPSCNRWFWHISCLKEIYEKRGIVCTTPIGGDSDWKCIHCLKTQWEFQSFIWTSWDFYPNLFVQFIYMLQSNVDQMLTKCWPNI